MKGLKPSFFLIPLMALTLTLSACGDSEGGGPDNDNLPPQGGTGTPVTSIPTNVAAQVSGATVTSSFSGNETFTIDGDLTTTNYWIGGAANDTITVDFGRQSTLKEITVYTNNTSFSVTGGTITAGIRLFLSTDGVNFSEVNWALGATSGSISCGALQIGNGQISCTLPTAGVAARFLRLQVTSDFATTQIYEIVALGL